MYYSFGFHIYIESALESFIVSNYFRINNLSIDVNLTKNASTESDLSEQNLQNNMK